jgi:hypothetical protein
MLALIGRGLSDAEIAAEHGLYPAKAQKHRSNLLRKLGVEGSAKLTAYAFEHGFPRFGPVRPGPWLGPDRRALFPSVRVAARSPRLWVRILRSAVSCAHTPHTARRLVCEPEPLR